MISPSRGTVYLIDTPLSADNEHQIKFDSKSDQESYFNNLSGGTTINYNYIRHENAMTIGLDYYTVLKYNYVFYQNTYVNGKWFFCFIDKVEFVNDESTKIYLKTDVYQTWQFDLEFKKSFIERRHYLSDISNSLSDIVSEGTLVEHKSFQMNFTGAYFVFCNADITQDDTTSSNGYDFTMGSFSIPSMVLMYREDQASSMAMDLQKIANKGYGDRVNSVVYVPACGVLDTMVVDTIGGFPVCRGTNYPHEILKQNISFDFSDVNLGYAKSLTYPYAKIVVQDITTGQTIELQPDKFGSKIINFEIQSTISETPSYRIIPLDYKNQLKSYSDSLVIKCNTSLPVANNMYAKYLMNNQDINNLKMFGAGVGVVGSIIGGSPMGAITGFESITGVMLQEQQAQKQPNQLSAITDGALERIQFQNGIKISLMVMDIDHRQTANNYWKLFGYPVRSLDYPTPYSNLDYQFIKTQGLNVSGAIPQNDLQEISNLFNKGITLWKSDKFRNY